MVYFLADLRIFETQPKAGQRQHTAKLHKNAGFFVHDSCFFKRSTSRVSKVCHLLPRNGKAQFCGKYLFPKKRTVIPKKIYIGLLPYSLYKCKKFNFLQNFPHFAMNKREDDLVYKEIYKDKYIERFRFDFRTIKLEN